MSRYFPFGDRPLSIFLLAADKMKSCLSWLWIWFAKPAFILSEIYPTMLLCWTIILHPSIHPSTQGLCSLTNAAVPCKSTAGTERHFSRICSQSCKAQHRLRSMCGSLPPSTDCHRRSRSNSCIQGLSPRCCYPWRGDNTPSERWQDAGLSWEEADFSYAVAEQTGFCPKRPLSSASALLTKQNEGLCCAIWQEVEHHCSILASPWILGLKMVSLVPHQVLGINDIFQDGHLLQLKSYCSSRFHIDITFWYESGTSQRWLFKETCPIKEPHFWKNAFGAHLPNECPLLSMQTWHHIQSWSSWTEAAGIVMGKCQEVLHWHHWDFCHWFQ